MRASEVIGGLSAIGVVVLIGFAIADDADSDTITTPTAPTILAPLDSTTDTSSPSAETTTSEPAADTDSTEAPVETEPAEAPATEPPATEAAAATTTTTTTTTIPSIPLEERAGVRVRVVNAGGPAGAATFVTGVLEGAGFDPVSPGDGVTNVDRDIVLFAPGQDLAALTVNESVGAAPEFVVEANPEDSNWAEFGSELDVLVLVGPR